MRRPPSPILSCCVGVPTTSLASRAISVAEYISLLIFRLALHGYITVVVLGSPKAFSSPLYFAMAALGMAYCNYMNAHRANSLLLPPTTAGAAVAAGAALAAVVG